jgi:membrane protein required for colicin V production
MFIDIIFLLLMVWAVIKGFRRGLIVSVFSLLAIIAGLAAAIKVSALVAVQIGKVVNVSDKWLPLISFIVVFLGIVLLVRLGANLIQKTVEIAMLGWVNRLGGILLYVVLFTVVYSIFLFYAEQLHFLKTETLQGSVTYAYIRPWGPKVINSLGSIIPFFKDMFTELQQFFGGVAEKLPASPTS